MAGLLICPLCVAVILGISKPLDVLVTSNIADASGLLPVVFIATWAEVVLEINSIAIISLISLIVFMDLWVMLFVVFCSFTLLAKTLSA